MQAAFKFDSAWALDPGGREYQEDALLSDVPENADVGLVILSDGMGGQAAGDVASNIVVSEAHATLGHDKSCVSTFEATIRDRLFAAVDAANSSIREHVTRHPDTEGMGATIVACALVNGSLYWISIGDSPLFLYRDGSLQQLNEDHSLAPQIDFMADAGLIDRDEAREHPDRNVLTSVIFGGQIAKIDCPEHPVSLKENDIVIVGSDGLQYLSDKELEDTIRKLETANSQSIATHLMSQATAIDDPDLDNVSFSVVKVKSAA
ncbi:MAG: protein phosphatase 2C domain-containing protein [Pseudomonadota bacterium]